MPKKPYSEDMYDMLIGTGGFRHSRSLVVFEEAVLLLWREGKRQYGFSDDDMEQFMKEHIGTVMYG